MAKHYAYLAALAILLAFAYWYSERQYQAGYTAAEVVYTKEKAEALENERVATASVQARLSTVSGQLAKAQRQIEIKARQVRELGKLYETANQRSNLCNLTVGGVLLHNSALGHASADSGQLADKGGEISTVTGAEFARHCDGLASEYERQRVQLNALIDAVRPRAHW
jgi:hypothetical protein